MLHWMAESKLQFSFQGCVLMLTEELISSIISIDTRSISIPQQLHKHLYNPVQAKTGIEANRKSLFPENMQLSHLAQPKGFACIDLLTCFALKALNYTWVLVKYSDNKYE